MNPVTAISLDLTAILDLAAHLEERALDQERRKSRSALAELSGVANQEAWAYRQQARPHDVDSDPTTTGLQILCVWTERIRRTYGLERPQNPIRRTHETEVAVIRWKLDALIRDLPEDDLRDLESDIRSCRRLLENVTLDGLRDEISKEVTCLADGCEEVFLVRRMLDEGDGKHARKGLADEWACPRCDRRYDGPAYNLAMAQAGRRAAEALVSQAARDAMHAAEGVA